ncbi:XRE family transcriptional regulator [Streptomyces sp. NPDC101213]|uniref:XRE family transcriptional regulator n=1 Tax=Streptomyces sp. NPDC101213 TaxID=3366130 RepID=UPI003824A823
MSVRPRGSRASRDALRRRMTDLGSPMSAIAQEMRAQFGFRSREAWRHAHGWSQQQVADRLSEHFAARPGDPVWVDASMVGKWEKWPVASDRKPRVAVLLALAGIYGCPVVELLDLEDRRALPPDDMDVLTRLEPAEPSGAELVRVAADESLTWARWAESSNVGDVSIAQLHARIRSLSAEYLQPGSQPLAVFRRARALRNTVFELLDGHQHPQQTSDLYLVGGYACGLLAWISSDLGHLAEAEVQGLTAWLCAELCRDATLRGWVLSVRSKTAFWDGRLKDAVSHARRGAACEPSGSVAVLLACQEADAWSALGAAAEADAALTRAGAAREALRARDDIGGLFACDLARQYNYAAAVNLRIGRPDQALRAADSALELMRSQPVRAYGTLAQTHISRAAAQLASGEAEGAHEALAPVLALPPEQRLAPVMERLTELSAGLTQRGGRAAVGLRAAIEGWRLDSAPRRLALSPEGVRG